MSVARLAHIPGFNIDRVAAAAGDDPDVLRLENLDTDIPPPAEAMAATRAALGEDEANSWLPFTGRDDLKEAVAGYIERRGGPRYDGRREIVITCGEGDAMLDALLLPDRSRRRGRADRSDLRGDGQPGPARRRRAASRPARVMDGEWRLDLDALRAAVTDRTRVCSSTTHRSRLAGWRTTTNGRQSPTICRERDLWLLYWAGFEGVLFDGRAGPASGVAPGHARSNGDGGRVHRSSSG